MADWNYDMSKAPRGRFRVVSAGGKTDATRRVFEPADIIVAGACGTVTVAHWLDDAKRWNMFTAEVPPVAWMPFAGPRAYVDDKGKARYAIDLPPHPTKATSWFQDLLAERRAA
jgi:hypothetical protein